jgi:hypothetical protein
MRQVRVGEEDDDDEEDELSRYSTTTADAIQDPQLCKECETE